ncbi:hypothetical protein KDK_69390 [Dictyobacter kobayashii]|uniref:Uncharacterized protein n=1 Tax=Dictyobacter kobayashii TaxID=2014872 RepID=A0A402AVN1_9CHLR|nr:hypothetical protein KDK_69390 [Dictyobacter kobayashii]
MQDYYFRVSQEIITRDIGPGSIQTLAESRIDYTLRAQFKTQAELIYQVKRSTKHNRDNKKRYKTCEQNDSNLCRAQTNAE